ncbi:hypothetical protein CBR_g70699 [Chara braunii]|uniref:Integrase catalytic domain-containing protein n=1 Tax=Chara braunii TaxID=69332 RepID=A0A388K9X4_CHABU|nr:hypothetical protein CBR_g70699 [Chara braunii]|eukprot:GBG66821.1 hypothetical protein CBR_g70699 [Chara braunii]
MSDRDTRFTSKDWKNFTSQIYDIKLNKTSGRHPEANGLAEEINQTVIQLLRALIVPDQNTWDKELHKVKGLYNNSIHSATGVTPNQLQYGWQLLNPLSYLFPERSPGLTPGMPGYNAQYGRLLKVAIAAMNKRQHAMIKHANKSRKEANFRVGDYVWVKMSEFSDEEGVSRKLLPLYYGPWQVLKVIGDDFGPSYVIDVPPHLRTYPVFHASKLFPHIDDETFPFRDPMIPRPIDDGHEIDKIVSHEGRGRNRQYKVHFLYHPLNEFFWIDWKELLKNAPRPSCDPGPAREHDCDPPKVPFAATSLLQSFSRKKKRKEPSDNHGIRSEIYSAPGRGTGCAGQLGKMAPHGKSQPFLLSSSPSVSCKSCLASSGEPLHSVCIWPTDSLSSPSSSITGRAEQRCRMKRGRRLSGYGGGDKEVMSGPTAPHSPTCTPPSTMTYIGEILPTEGLGIVSPLLLSQMMAMQEQQLQMERHGRGLAETATKKLEEALGASRRELNNLRRQMEQALAAESKRRQETELPLHKERKQKEIAESSFKTTRKKLMQKVLDKERTVRKLAEGKVRDLSKELNDLRLEMERTLQSERTKREKLEVALEYEKREREAEVKKMKEKERERVEEIMNMWEEKLAKGVEGERCKWFMALEQEKIKREILGRILNDEWVKRGKLDQCWETAVVNQEVDIRLNEMEEKARREVAEEKLNDERESSRKDCEGRWREERGCREEAEWAKQAEAQHRWQIEEVLKELKLGKEDMEIKLARERERREEAEEKLRGVEKDRREVQVGLKRSIAQAMEMEREASKGAQRLERMMAMALEETGKRLSLEDKWQEEKRKREEMDAKFQEEKLRRELLETVVLRAEKISKLSTDRLRLSEQRVKKLVREQMEMSREFEEEKRKLKEALEVIRVEHTQRQAIEEVLRKNMRYAEDDILADLRTEGKTETEAWGKGHQDMKRRQYGMTQEVVSVARKEEGREIHVEGGLREGGLTDRSWGLREGGLTDRSSNAMTNVEAWGLTRKRIPDMAGEQVLDSEALEKKVGEVETGAFLGTRDVPPYHLMDQASVMPQDSGTCVLDAGVNSAKPVDEKTGDSVMREGADDDGLSAGSHLMSDNRKEFLVRSSQERIGEREKRAIADGRVDDWSEPMSKESTLIDRGQTQHNGAMVRPSLDLTDRLKIEPPPLIARCEMSTSAAKQGRSESPRAEDEATQCRESDVEQSEGPPQGGTSEEALVAVEGGEKRRQKNEKRKQQQYPGLGLAVTEAFGRLMDEEIREVAGVVGRRARSRKEETWQRYPGCGAMGRTGGHDTSDDENGIGEAERTRESNPFQPIAKECRMEAWLTSQEEMMRKRTAVTNRLLNVDVKVEETGRRKGESELGRDDPRAIDASPGGCTPTNAESDARERNQPLISARSEGNTSESSSRLEMLSNAEEEREGVLYVLQLVMKRAVEDVMKGLRAVEKVDGNWKISAAVMTLMCNEVQYWWQRMCKASKDIGEERKRRGNQIGNIPLGELVREVAEVVLKGMEMVRTYCDLQVEERARRQKIEADLEEALAIVEIEIQREHELRAKHGMAMFHSKDKVTRGKADLKTQQRRRQRSRKEKSDTVKEKGDGSTKGWSAASRRNRRRQTVIEFGE